MSKLFMWNSLTAWIVVRAISIPMAIIIGLEPLFDEVYTTSDLIFPIFTVLTAISQLRIMALRSKAIQSKNIE